MSMKNKSVERILAGVGGGGQPVVDIGTELPTIKGGNPTDLAGRYMEYVRRYFNETANQKTYCENNGIIYDSEIDIFSMQELFKKALSGYAPDKLYYFNANHLGSGSLITDEHGQTYQTLIYAPHGEVLFNRFYGDYDEVYKFTGYEKDNESGLDYAKARYHEVNLGFTSTDPHCFKYPSRTAYNYSFNNPINVIDPDGREGIVVTGSPGKEKMDQHFLINGLDRAKKAQARTEKGEGTTWLIYNDKEQGFNQEYLDKYTAQAKEAGINVKVVSEVSDITGYINDKNGGDTRSNDQISSFYYVGHSTPGDLDVGYQGSGQNFDPSDLSSKAFKSGAWVNVVGGCRTAVDFKILGITFEKSIIRQFADILDKKSTIHGSDVRVFYPGGVAADKSLLRKNNGNIITINGVLKK